ncbi:hypothetical protein L1887_60169 [Cichorium endivia]|nr:hypothetical protein L1887_60169 [Cichorium endivia]
MLAWLELGEVAGEKVGASDGERGAHARKRRGARRRAAGADAGQGAHGTVIVGPRDDHACGRPHVFARA